MTTMRITYLYPHHMNLYGDTGNIICLQKRCAWRNINVEIKMVNPGEDLKSGETDLYFFGGGQDAQQTFIASDLQRHHEVITKDIEEGVPALTICGGYQLFGRRFITKDLNEVPGIGIFNVETHGSDHRMIGNCIVQLAPAMVAELKLYYPNATDTLVGFENHSGETTIPIGTSLGSVQHGFGNNYTSKAEGYRYKNAFGTYLHGSLLPKNPHLADFLLSKAIEHRTGEQTPLQPLDDSLEWQAHRAILSKHHLST